MSDDRRARARWCAFLRSVDRCVHRARGSLYHPSARVAVALFGGGDLIHAYTVFFRVEEKVK
jgi:hypothetical protein